MGTNNGHDLTLHPDEELAALRATISLLGATDADVPNDDGTPALATAAEFIALMRDGGAEEHHA